MTSVRYSCTCTVVSLNRLSVQSDRSLMPAWLTRARTSTVASGGVNVPSVAHCVTLGKNPPVPTTEWRGASVASTRENELNHLVRRNSSATPRRMFQKQPILQDRAARFQPRAEGADPFDIEWLTATAEPEGGIEVVEPRLPCVAGP